MRISSRMLALGATSILVFAACSSAGASTAPSAAASQPAMSEAPSASAAASASAGASASAAAINYKACVAFDTGGLGDKGFNDLALKGLNDAKAAGFQTAYSQAKSATDYANNIQTLVDQSCQTIITVGFNQTQATKDAVTKNPTIAFGQVDTTWDPSGPDGKVGTADDVPQPANFTGLSFQIDQAGMLAGYLGAGFSKSGKLGTYGGQQFPGVTLFMDGLYAGIKYYNQKNGTTVTLLGWDAPTQKGTFVGGNNPWGDPAKGEQLAKTFLDQGADIVQPVSGGTGNGTIKAMMAAGKYAFGVDTDQALSLPDYAPAIITSSQKVIDVAVLDLIKANQAGTMGGKDYVGTLANNGVALAPYHNFANQIPAALSTAIDQLKADIASGTVKVSDYTK